MQVPRSVHTSGHGHQKVGITRGHFRCCLPHWPNTTALRFYRSQLPLQDFHDCTTTWMEKVDWGKGNREWHRPLSSFGYILSVKWMERTKRGWVGKRIFSWAYQGSLCSISGSSSVSSKMAGFMWLKSAGTQEHFLTKILWTANRLT